MKNRILFVCLGNICRSPLAEGIMLHLLQQKQLDLTIDSAGTADYHINEAPDKRTINNAKQHGVDLSSLRARLFVKKDFHDFDLILAMDKHNMQNILKYAENSEHQKKVHLFLDYANNSVAKEVPDPYYGSESDFDLVFQMVHAACEALIKKMAS